MLLTRCYCSSSWFICAADIWERRRSIVMLWCSSVGSTPCWYTSSARSVGVLRSCIGRVTYTMLPPFIGWCQQTVRRCLPTISTLLSEQRAESRYVHRRHSDQLASIESISIEAAPLYLLNHHISHAQHSPIQSLQVSLITICASPFSSLQLWPGWLQP